MEDVITLSDGHDLIRINRLLLFPYASLILMYIRIYTDRHPQHLPTYLPLTSN